MNEWVGRWPDSLVSAEASLDREFEERLRDSSSLAFGIAYGVLRNRADAEEVAQDAFARAFRRFRQLRDRDRFRSWLTRMTWRLAIDRWRTDRRRTAREYASVSEPWKPSTEDVAVARERSKHVWLAIDRLPEKLRLVVVCRRSRDTTRGKSPFCSKFLKGPSSPDCFRRESYLRRTCDGL